jgi:hypothetical protein
MPYGMAKGRLGRIRQPWYSMPVVYDRLQHAPYTRPKIQPLERILYLPISAVVRPLMSGGALILLDEECRPLHSKIRNYWRWLADTHG